MHPVSKMGEKDTQTNTLDPFLLFAALGKAEHYISRAVCQKFDLAL